MLVFRSLKRLLRSFGGGGGGLLFMFFCHFLCFVFLFGGWV